MSRGELAVGDHDVMVVLKLNYVLYERKYKQYQRATDPPFCGIHLLLWSVAFPRTFGFIHRLVSA